MTKHKETHEPHHHAPGAAHGDKSSAPQPEGAATPGGVEEFLAQKLAEKTQEAEANYDKYVRTVAELDNIRKRSAKERADAVKFGNEALLRDILPLLDGLDRALKHAEASRDFDAFKSGLEMLRSQLMSCLEKHGVEPIACAQTIFDPNVHEALLRVASPDHRDNEIVDELEKGYLLNGRLLRPAKVSVCKPSENGKETC